MLKDLVTQGIQEFGITAPPNVGESFAAYYELLEERGKVTNLTTVTGAQDVARLHFVDSISLLTFVDFGDKRVIDIGSGAGFPGIPLKVVKPEIGLTLLDSSLKRISFVTEVCERLNLDIECVHGRAEEFVNEGDNRQSWDIAVSRALARLNQLSELCLPYVSLGGAFIAMKSTSSDEEINEAGKALEILGGKVEKCIDYIIPGTDIAHRAVIIRKTAETPPNYPRRFARIQKSPL